MTSVLKKIQKQQEVSLSEAFYTIKRSIQSQAQSNFWFGSIIKFACSYQIVSIKILEDISDDQQTELRRMINTAITDIICFYIEMPKGQVFHLLTFLVIIGGLKRDFYIPSKLTYQDNIQEIYLMNNLSFFMLKFERYSEANQCFQYIYNVTKQKSLDISKQIFTIALSNYLAFLKKSGMVHLNQKVNQIKLLLKQTFKKLLAKYTQNGCKEASLQILLAIYKQHKNGVFLSAFDDDIKNLMKKIQTQHTHNVFPINENTKIQQQISKVKEKKKFVINIQKKYLYFFGTTLQTIERKQRWEKNSVELSRNNDDIRNGLSVQLLSYESQAELGHGKNQGSTINLENLMLENRRKVSIKEKMKINNKIYEIQEMPKKQEKTFEMKQSVELNSIAQILNMTNIKKELEKSALKKTIAKKNLVVLKVNNQLVKVDKNGVIICSYTNDKQTFIEWKSLYKIFKCFKFSFLFNEFLPLDSYYEVARILYYYVTRKDGVPIISNLPRELIYVDYCTKVFQNEGNYIKFIALNQYDPSHKELVLDIYIHQFNEFFIKSKKNQYHEKLNKKLLGLEEDIEEENEPCCFELLKKKRQTTGDELRNQINVQEISNTTYVQSSLFKIFLIMPKNKQLLFQITSADIQSSQYQTIVVRMAIYDYSKSRKIEDKFSVSMFKYHDFFPINRDNPLWLKKYGKIIFETLIDRFYDYAETKFKNLQLNFQVVAKISEISSYGKYYSIVSAEIVASRSRVFGLVIRHYDLSNCKNIVTFIYNPIHDLLLPILDMNMKDDSKKRNKILKSLLPEGGVSTAYNKLKNLKLIGSTLGLFTYLKIIEY